MGLLYVCRHGETEADLCQPERIRSGDVELLGEAFGQVADIGGML